MRTILRAAGSTARVFLWIVKSLLLLLAVAVLVLWPMSRGTTIGAVGFKYTKREQWMDLVIAHIECSNGRILVRREARHDLLGLVQGLPIEQAAYIGKGWRWKTVSNGSAGFASLALEGGGPLRWKFEAMYDPDYAYEWRTIAVSCWLLVPLLALWPLVSITLLIRHRTRRRRRTATGRCLSCGYDLRATTSPVGGLLGVCPECGTENEKAKGEDR